MHSVSRTHGQYLLTLMLALALILSACGPKTEAAPTQSVEEIYTAAFETLAAQQATQLALTPPTSTPSPTLAATLPPPSPIATFAFASPTLGGGGGAGTCDSAVYVTDVTIPDNTTVTAGKKFTKTWRLLNNGSCTWGSGYKLAFDSGDQMGGASSAISVPVPSGSVTDISVVLTAPTDDGIYKGFWRMQNASSQPFGNQIFVQVQVGEATTATAGPSPTAGAGMLTISGSLGAVDATLDFSGATTIPTVSYSGSDYSFTVPSGWSGTIIPSKGNPGHWEFDPSSKTFTNVTKDRTQDFTAIPVTPTPK